MSKILVLGAGASNGHGMLSLDRPPLMKDFFSPQIKQQVDNSYSSLYDYIEKFDDLKTKAQFIVSQCSMEQNQKQCVERNVQSLGWQQGCDFTEEDVFLDVVNNMKLCFNTEDDDCTCKFIPMRKGIDVETKFEIDDSGFTPTVKRSKTITIDLEKLDKPGGPEAHAVTAPQLKALIKAVIAEPEGLIETALKANINPKSVSHPRKPPKKPTIIAL